MNWECCEIIGGYLGSTFGGISADRFGLRVATNVVLCFETAILVLLLMLLFLDHTGRVTLKTEELFFVLFCCLPP